MRIRIYLLLLMLAMVFIICNCENLEFPEQNTDVPLMRISKVSCNRNMENAKVFDYNSENLLIKISPELFDSPLYFIYDIEYNAENKPIQITESMHLSGNKTVCITKIEWTKNGYMLLNDDKTKSVVLLDAQNRIIKIDDTKFFTWFGDDSLIVENSSSNIIEKYKYTKYRHPLSGIPNLIFHVANIYLCEWEEWQNKYCVDEWEKSGSCSGRFFYTLNDQNYPIEMRKRFESCFGTSYGTLFFEYEFY